MYNKRSNSLFHCHKYGKLNVWIELRNACKFINQICTFFNVNMTLMTTWYVRQLILEHSIGFFGWKFSFIFLPTPNIIQSISNFKKYLQSKNVVLFLKKIFPVHSAYIWRFSQSLFLVLYFHLCSARSLSRMLWFMCVKCVLRLSIDVHIKQIIDEYFLSIRKITTHFPRKWVWLTDIKYEFW